MIAKEEDWLNNLFSSLFINFTIFRQNLDWKMAYLEQFGFEIYKLRDAKSENEILIYNSNNHFYYRYSESRAIKNIKLELKTIGIDIRDFAVNELHLNEKINTDKLVEQWFYDEMKLIDTVGFKPQNVKFFERFGKTHFNTYKLIETLDKKKYLLYDKKQKKYYKDENITFEDLKSKCPNIIKLLNNKIIK